MAKPSISPNTELLGDDACSNFSRTLHEQPSLGESVQTLKVQCDDATSDLLKALRLLPSLNTLVIECGTIDLNALNTIFEAATRSEILQNLESCTSDHGQSYNVFIPNHRRYPRLHQ